MFKKLNDILAGVPATLVGGAFLLCSFLLPKLGVELPFDPAWITVFISGIPLLYLQYGGPYITGASAKFPPRT